MSGGQDFWSRRRAGVEAEARAQQEEAEADAIAKEHVALEDMPEEEALKELGLPDPDSMQMGDDFSVFMAKAVPERIRRRALRTLWRSNPVLANVDMLVDYGEDFTDSATVIENLQTAYQVGKGMLKHVQAMEEQALAELESADAGAPEAEEVVDHVETTDTACAEDVLNSDPDDLDRTLELGDDPTQENSEIATVAPMKRRMKFRTEEAA